MVWVQTVLVEMKLREPLSSGFDPDKIVFAGVGKTDKEIEYAIDKTYFLHKL